MRSPDCPEIPLFDLRDFHRGGTSKQAFVKALRSACVDLGFFYIEGHGVDRNLQLHLEDLSQKFFAEDENRKMQIRMDLAGRAWRGYFPLGGELTSGQPDRKEGLYFGQELALDHPKVKAGLPLHGANLFPEIKDFREVVLQYIQATTRLGHDLMRILSLSLDLQEDYFYKHFTHDPLILFRIFHYPPDPDPKHSQNWGVGEHTDYGLLTILKQDDCGGLQIKSREHWIEAPPVFDSFVCNIGDMLERMTGGFYRSTPHRVRNVSGRERYSYPLFFDPGFDVEVHLLPNATVDPDDKNRRWDKASVHDFKGTYGDYLLTKIGRVFPELKKVSLGDEKA